MQLSGRAISLMVIVGLFSGLTTAIAQPLTDEDRRTGMADVVGWFSKVYGGSSEMRKAQEEASRDGRDHLERTGDKVAAVEVRVFEYSHPETPVTAITTRIGGYESGADPDAAMKHLLVNPSPSIRRGAPEGAEFHHVIYMVVYSDGTTRYATNAEVASAMAARTERQEESNGSNQDEGSSGQDTSPKTEPAQPSSPSLAERTKSAWDTLHNENASGSEREAAGRELSDLFDKAEVISSTAMPNPMDLDGTVRPFDCAPRDKTCLVMRRDLTALQMIVDWTSDPASTLKLLEREGLNTLGRE